MVGGGMIGLVVPRTVVDEFERKKKSIIERSTKSFSDVVRHVCQVAQEIGEPKKNKKLFEQLADIEFKAQQDRHHSALTGIEIVERLFANSTIIEKSQHVLERASARAIQSQAPFHRGKNKFSDAIIIEIYADECCKARAGDTFAFITQDKGDFSAPNDHRLPHPDIASYFASPNSKFSLSLLETLREFDPEPVDEFQGMFDSTEPRRLSEIIEEAGVFLDKIWYDRHMVLRHKVETGKVKVVPGVAAGKSRRNMIQADAWKGAKAAAARIRKKYGAKNLGPYSKFEWGMINGKLSALNWVMGEDWDILDT
jgi:hypothetical protein